MDFLENITSLIGSTSELIFKSTLSLLFGILSHYVVVRSGENIFSTNHSKMTFYLLPPISTSITFAISGDIALSLGMVGALSIIRFRTPVRNPFELIIYFYLITIGISSAVDAIIPLVLFIILSIVLFSNTFIGGQNKKYDYLNNESTQIYLSTKSKFLHEEFSEDLRLIYFSFKEKGVYEYSFFVLNENVDGIVNKITENLKDNLVEINFSSSINEN